MTCVLPAGGVFLSSGVLGSDGGGGDAHQAGSRQGRAGEVSAIQRRLQRSQERKGSAWVEVEGVQKHQMLFLTSSFFFFFF